MTLFHGFLAVAVFLLLIGFTWPIKGRIDVLSLTTLTVAKSMWLSWMVVFSSYWLNLGDVSAMVLLAVTLLTLWRLRQGGVADVWFSGYGLLLAIALMGIGYALSPLEAIKPILEGQIVLSGWDVNASWNNWAMQLFENTYSPYIAAYPLFLPGLWSLIYKAQANPMVWVMTRLMLCAFPLILMIQIGSLAIARRPLAALLVFLSLWEIFLANPLLLIGLTDPIVMMLTLIAGVALYLAICSDEREGPVDHYTLCAALFAGVGAITKQPGTLSAVIVGLGLLLVGIHRSKQLTWYLVRLLVLVLPVATFMLIFFTRPSLPTALGNLSFLMSLTSKASAGGGIYEHGWSYVVSMFGRFPLLLMLTLAALNLATPKRKLSQIGLLYLAGFGIAFTTYSNCCAYDERNGWFLIALLSMSAVCGVSILEGAMMRELAPWRRFFGRLLRHDDPLARPRSIRSAQLQLLAIVLAVTVAGLLQMVVGESRYLEAEKNARRNIVWPTVNNLAYLNIDSLGKGLIITNYQFVSLLPDLEKRYRICPDIACVAAAIKQFPGSRVLIGPESFDYPPLRAALGPGDYLATEAKYGFSLTRGLTINDLPLNLVTPLHP